MVERETEKRAFDRVAWAYDTYMQRLGLYREEKILELLELRGHEMIVDLCGGTGYLAERIGSRCKQITIVDYSKRMLSIAQCRSGLHVVEGDASDTPFSDEEFDVALLTDSLHHVENQEGLVREAWRILRPCGRLLVHDFDRGQFLGKVEMLVERVLFRKVFFRKRVDIRALLERNGFRISKEVRGSGWFMLVGEK